MMIIDQKKVVARNTMIMFLRMILLMCITFFTSRLLLSTLGVTDFGILSVIGSISSTFYAIKSLFSEAIQRFLNVAKGKGDDSMSEQISIFNMSIIVHMMLVVVFVIVVEFVGAWLLDTKLDIPMARMTAARFVFQMAVLATSISILSIPYDALVIANERMGVYAGLTVLDGVLKLLFILFLPVLGVDNLMAYSVFLVFIPLLTLLIEIFYCRKFNECCYSFSLNKDIFRSVMSLSGWNFFGNISFSIIHEGINMLLNVHGGIVMNASRAIAYQVRNVANQISTNTLIAARPRIMQQSVQKSKDLYFENIFLLSRVSYFSLSLAIVPIFIYCPQLLDLWLKDVPSASVLFTRLLLVGLYIRTLHEPLNIMNMAFAKIKRMMILEAIIMIFSLIVIYVTLKHFGFIWLPFTILSIMEFVIILCLVLNAKKELDFPLREYFKKVIFPMFLFAVFSSCIGSIFHRIYMPSNLFTLILCVCTIILFEIGICWLFLNNREKQILVKIMRK